MKIAVSLNFNNFLIMPPAYYNYEDKDDTPDKGGCGGGVGGACAANKNQFSY